MADFHEKNVKCPYFERMSERRIRCEGINSETSLSILFKDREQLEQYLETYCFGVKACHTCLICKMLDQKWAEVYGIKFT